MSNKINKSVFFLLMITCHHAFGDTECAHYYIPMMEDTMASFFFMGPANSSTYNLDDFISDIGVSRNCVVLFDCFKIEYNACESPVDIKPSMGKTEFIGSTDSLKPIKTKLLPSTTIWTTENEVTATTIDYPMTEEVGVPATTPLLTSGKQEVIAPTTLLPMNTQEEEIATLLSQTSKKEAELATTLNPMTVEDEKLTTSPETSEQRPLNNSIELEDKYLIKIDDNCILNVSVFIKKNGCKVNSDDGDNETLIYDCENFLIDDCNESQDQLNMNKLNERNLMNCPVIIKETASDTDFILRLNYDTGRGTLSKNDKNPFNLTVVCNNDTHSKCESIKHNSVWRSKIFLYIASNPPLGNNRIELVKFLNGSENNKCEPLRSESNPSKLNTVYEVKISSTTSIPNYSTGLSPTNSYNINYENSNTSKSVTTIINEGNAVSNFNGISSKESTNVNSELSNTGYEDNNKSYVTSPSPNVTGGIYPENTLSHFVITTASDVGTTVRTTLTDASSESSKQKSASNKENIILPVLLVSLGSLAAAILIWMAIRKCIDLKKSGQYHIPETVEMNEGFTAC